MNSPQVKDLSKILEPYSDEWVALSYNEKTVISSGKNLPKVIEEAQKKGEKRPIVTKVPKDYGNYVLGM